MSSAPYHTPVLLDEAVSFLAPAPAGVFVDATLGGGGHAEALLARLDRSSRVIGIDADADAIRAASERLQPFGARFTAAHGNFERLDSILASMGVSSISGILFDLGVSSFQLDRPEKGFSFRSDEPLDMRMDQSESMTAETVVNTYPTDDLARIFRDYGEERFAFRIAKGVTRQRTKERIRTSHQLVELIGRVVGERNRLKSLARIFQALRIEVNRELERLDVALRHALRLSAPEGRIVVISYHSLEDRIVKTLFKDAAATRRASGTKLIPDQPVQPAIEILTKKPLRASEEEVRRNPRSRSARLRCARRLNDGTLAPR